VLKVQEPVAIVRCRVDISTMTIFSKVLLAVGIMCLGFAGWSLIRGETSEAILGFALGFLLLIYWRWALRQRARQTRLIGPSDGRRSSR
jgi:hypothetical protein